MQDLEYVATIGQIRQHYSQDWPMIRDYMIKIMAALDPKAPADHAWLWNTARLAQLMAEIDFPPAPNGNHW